MEGHGDNKQKALTNLLYEVPPKDEQTIIFCNTLGCVRSLQSWLTGIPAIQEVSGGLDRIGVLHGKLTQEERKKMMKAFQQGDISLLISTDVASRGLDSRHTKHVILYDFPYSATDYLHRVGRTARAGAGGKATSLIGKKDKKLADQIQVCIRSCSVVNNRVCRVLSVEEKQYHKRITYIDHFFRDTVLNLKSCFYW